MHSSLQTSKEVMIRLKIIIIIIILGTAQVLWKVLQQKYKTFNKKTL